MAQCVRVFLDYDVFVHNDPDRDPDPDHDRDHDRDPDPDCDPDHDRDPDHAPDRIFCFADRITSPCRTTLWPPSGYTGCWAVVARLSSSFL